MYVVKRDNRDILSKMQSVKTVMVMDSGTLEPYQGCYKLIVEHNCIKSIDADYHSTEKTVAQRGHQQRM